MTIQEQPFDGEALYTVSIDPAPFDEATEQRIRHIVRQELANLLPDIKRALRDDVLAYLTKSVNARSRNPQRY